MNREKALELLHTHMQNQNLRRHCYAVEAVMKALAKKFGEDEEIWGVVGLLHDGDYEAVAKNPSRHTLQMVEWLNEQGVTDGPIIEAILSHNFAHTGQNPPKNQLEWSLYCCDELTGLVVAVALVKGKSLANVTVESVLKKFPEKAFAAGVHREQISACEEKLNIPLPEFVTIALKAMQQEHSTLGL